MNSANMLRRAIIGSKKSSAPHTVLSYLQSSGTQHINTGFVASGETRAICEFMNPAISSTRWIFGARVSPSAGRFALLYSNADATNGSIRHDYGADTNNEPDISTLYMFGLKVKVDTNKNVFTTYSENGDVVKTFTYPLATFSTNVPIVLFGINTNGAISRSAIRIYSYKMYSATGELIQDLIPVLKTDGTYCMYDNVTSTYFLNQGTGSFTGA